MKTLKSYSPILIQALILISGFIMINAGLANETNSLSTNSTLLIVENELEPIAEDWMTDLNSWNIEKSYEEKTEKSLDKNSKIILLNEIVFEEEIAIEDWMKDADNSFWNSDSNLNKVDKEEEIELEDWMTNPAKWNN